MKADQGENEDSAGDTEGKSYDIDGCIGFVTTKVAPTDLETPCPLKGGT
jgi:hypothetical protein